MEPVLTGPPSPGISNEVVTFYRAKGLTRVGRGGGEEGEDMRAHVVPLSGLGDWLGAMQSKGYQVDPKVFVGAYILRQEMDECMYE